MQAGTCRRLKETSPHSENKARRRNISDNLLTYFNPYQSHAHSTFSIIWYYIFRTPAVHQRDWHSDKHVSPSAAVSAHTRETDRRGASTRSDICRRWYGHRGALKMSSCPWGRDQQQQRQQQQHLALSSSLTRNLAECDLADSWLSLCHFAVQSLPPDEKETNGAPQAQLLQLEGARAKCGRMLCNDDVLVRSRRSHTHIAYCKGENGEATKKGASGWVKLARHLCTLLSVSLEREL